MTLWQCMAYRPCQSRKRILMVALLFGTSRTVSLRDRFTPAGVLLLHPDQQYWPPQRL